MNNRVKNVFYISGIVGVEAIVIWLLSHYFFANPRYEYHSISEPVFSEWLEPSVPVPPIPPKLREDINQSYSFAVATFPVGTSEADMLAVLGKPTWRRQGYWENSIAYSYEDTISKDVDFGYIFDDKTRKIRQSEVAVPSSTNLKSLQNILEGFLQGQTLTIAYEGLEKVYFRQQRSQEFQIGNLKGIIKRNEQDRIYMAVWEMGFH